MRIAASALPHFLLVTARLNFYSQRLCELETRVSTGEAPFTQVNASAVDGGSSGESEHCFVNKRDGGVGFWRET